MKQHLTVKDQITTEPKTFAKNNIGVIVAFISIAALAALIMSIPGIILASQLMIIFMAVFTITTYTYAWNQMQIAAGVFVEPMD
jgi:uncharacterized membrane protein